MDVITDPRYDTMVVMKSARTGFTKGCVTAAIGYWMAQDPGAVLLLQPTEADADGYSKEDITPMIRDVPQVAAIGPRGTLSDLTFPGGALHLRGVNSARAARRLTVSRVIFEEPDAYPSSMAGEGDPITLGMKRAEDADDAMFIIGSSPKLKETSIIEPWFMRSDQRRFVVPCPHCDHGQWLRWGGKDRDYGFKFERDKPDEIAYLCEQCHCTIEWHQQWPMVEQGLWLPQNVGGEFPGFHIWTAYSNLPRATWPHMARAWIDATGDAGTPEKLQTFVNTWLGETWEERGESPQHEKLKERRERYPMREGVVEGGPLVPSGVGVLTAGGDVQGNRIEIQTTGWGIGEECWPVDYSVFYGDPTGDLVWREVWEYLNRPRWFESGGADYIRSACVDAGYASESVYRFVANRSVYATADGNLAYLWAVMGGRKKGPVFPATASASKLKSVPMYMLNETAAKDELYGRLDQVTEPGPRFIHIPEHFQDDYEKQLTAEQVKQKRNARGYAVREYHKKIGHDRNESLDTWGYAYAALCALYMRGFDLEAHVAGVRKHGLSVPPVPSRPTHVPEQESKQPQRGAEPATQPRARGGYLGGGRRGGWLGRQ